MSEDSLRSYIRDEVSVLQRKIRHEKSLKHSLISENKATVKYMSSWEYVWNMFQAIDTGIFKNSLEEVVYEMATTSSGGRGSRDICTGQIALNGSVLTLQKESFGYMTYPEKFRKFVQEFHSRNKNCTISMLAINARGIKEGEEYFHRNILFFYKSSSGITVAIYEPWGYEPEDSHTKSVSDFVQFFIRTYNQMYGSSNMVLLGRTETSCPIGLQVEEPGSGYCVMYSYLWFYMVCRVSQKMNRDTGFVRSVFNYLVGKDNVLSALKNVEKILLEILSEEEVVDLVHNFAGFVVNSYIEYMSARYPEDRQKFILHLEKEVERALLEKEEKSVRRTLYNRPVKGLKRNVETGYEESERGVDGEFCVSDEDCLSDNCEEGKCTPYDYRRRT